MSMVAGIQFEPFQDMPMTRHRNRPQNTGPSQDIPLWLDDDAFIDPPEPRGARLKRRLQRLVVAGVLLIVLALIACYFILNPTALQRHRLVGHWVEVEAYATVFTTFGSEIDFGTFGEYEKLEFADGGGAYQYHEQGRWSLEEVNGDEMTVRMIYRPESGDSHGPNVYVMHVKFVSPRRIEVWSEGSTGSYTYERR